MNTRNRIRGDESTPGWTAENHALWLSHASACIAWSRDGIRTLDFVGDVISKVVPRSVPTLDEHALAVAQEGLRSLDEPHAALSKVVRTAIRVARLRLDHDSLLWLELEMESLDSQGCPEYITDELRSHYNTKEWSELWVRALRDYNAERRCRMKLDNPTIPGDGFALLWSVPEIERKLEFFTNQEPELKNLMSDRTQPHGPEAEGLLFKMHLMGQTTTVELRAALERIGHRLHQFLSSTETELIRGQTFSTAFERNRTYVEGALSELSPTTLGELRSALRRTSEAGDPARAQALVACRRVLKELADLLYPASSQSIRCADGETREMTESKYINRLWQFLYERSGTSSLGVTLRSAISDLGNRLDSLHDLMNKGIHASVSDHEVDTCVIQTYQLVGDLLRVRDSGVAGRSKATPGSQARESLDAPPAS